MCLGWTVAYLGPSEDGGGGCEIIIVLLKKSLFQIASVEFNVGITSFGIDVIRNDVSLNRICEESKYWALSRTTEDRWLWRQVISRTAYDNNN